MNDALDKPVRKALVLAAGASTRIRAAAGDRPKPLIEVAGRTVLERNLEALAAAGVERVWINLHYEGKQIESLIGNGARYGLNVAYSWEPTLLGTAGAAKKLERELGDESFFIVYGDNLTALNWRQMIRHHRQADAAATIAVFDRDRVPNTGLAGGRVIIGSQGRILNFVEGAGSDSPMVNAGVYLIEPRVLDLMPDGVFCDFGKDVFPAMLSKGEVLTAFPIDGHCLGIDTPEALRRAEELLARCAPQPEVIAS